jgi:phenylacetate-coenzyme A ligase PaaK-like adenylate-forming protein
LQANSSREALDTFRQALLPATLANALRAPFYCAHLAGLSGVELQLDELCRLPFVTKAQIAAAGSDAQITHGTICNEIFTGGTTGAPLVTKRSDVEQRYIANFYQEVFADDFKMPLKRALQINNPYHGHLVPVPVPLHSHKIGIYDAGSFAYGRQVLTHEHRDRGVEPDCTLLIGLERALRAFTVEARRACPDGLDTKLAAVISCSQFLTARWRRLMEETWNCPVIDRFGLSEVFGGATEDPERGWWHFEPVCVPEVVGSRSREPVAEGVGELVLTALYPFQQVQPMIRYLTGDLVEVTHSRSSAPGTLAIRPLGRKRYGVPDPEGDGFLLAPSDILEAVEAVPGVRRMPRFRDSAQVSDPYGIGHPLYSTHHEIVGGKTVITLSVTADERSRPPVLRRSLYEELTRVPSLQRALQDHLAELRIQVVDELSPDLISHAE